MKLEQVPPPDRVTAELLPALKVLYAAVESAILQTVEYFEREHAPVDPSLAPNLVRYYAKRYLDSVDAPLMDAEIERHELSNNGLLVTFGSHQIRVLKSDNGRVPVPGNSFTKRDFYQQPLPLIAMTDEGSPLPALKLIALWDAAPSSYAFLGLSLALPMSGGEDRASVQCHWQRTITEEMIAAPSAKGAPSDDQVMEPEDDLPISQSPFTKSSSGNANGDSA